MDDVWCCWSGANVLVHLRLVNTYDAPTVLEITPRYVTASGQHGAFSGSHSVWRLMPGEIATVELVAGTPRGDGVGEPITACTPRLEDAAAAIVLTLGLAALVRSCRRSAARGVKGGGVSCHWRGSNVFVHVVVRNRSRIDRLRARIGPRVTVDGVRSTSMENDVELTLAPHDRIVLDRVADGLDGLKLGAPITRCSVRLMSAFSAPGGG